MGPLELEGLPAMAPPVEKSSQVEALAYDAGLMYARFKGGKVYRYMHVGRELFESIRTAPSPGRAIRAVTGDKGAFPFRQVVVVANAAPQGELGMNTAGQRDGGEHHQS